MGEVKGCCALQTVKPPEANLCYYVDTRDMSEGFSSAAELLSTATNVETSENTQMFKMHVSITSVQREISLCSSDKSVFQETLLKAL